VRLVKTYRIPVKIARKPVKIDRCTQKLATM